MGARERREARHKARQEAKEAAEEPPAHQHTPEILRRIDEALNP